MPVTSKRQFRYFKAIEQGTAKKKDGPTKEQAKEATKGQSPTKLPEKARKKK